MTYRSRFGLIGLMLAFCATDTVMANGLVTTRQECNRRCNANAFKPNAFPEKFQRHTEKIKAIQAKILAEQNQEKRQALKLAEQDEIDSYKDEHQESCEKMCRFNPDE